MRKVAWSLPLSLSALSLNDDLPMTKVIKQLEDMQNEVEAELKKDQDMRDKMECWCETNTKEKKQAIEDAERTIDELNSRIQGAAGAKGSAGATLEKLEKDLAESKAALKEATKIRQDEAAKFHESEKEMLEAVKLLQGAITALEKHHPSMLQSDEVLGAMKPSLRKMIHQHLDVLTELKPGSAEADALLEFVDGQPALLEPDDAPSFLQTHKTKKVVLPFKSYTPQSGQIMGVLKQMKEDFEKDLPEAQAIELKKSSAFAELKASKMAEIKEMETQKKEKNQEHSNMRVQLVEDKDDLKDTTAAMNADIAFLREVQKRCLAADDEWEKRKKTRLDEITAISEAIKILSTDEVRDAQQTTFGFFQVSVKESRSKKQELNRALAKLQRTAPANADVLALIELAKADPFGKINEAIDKLVAKLKLQQADEVKHRDYCVNSLHENEVVTQRKTSDKNRLDALIEDLENQHKVLTDEISELKSEISQLQVELQRAAENRKAENLLYQKTVAGQMQQQEALAKAYAKLEEFYHAKSSFLQRAIPKQSADDYFNSGAPEMGSLQPNSGAKGVMGLMQKLQGEAKVLMDDTINDEQNAQTAYETMIDETNGSVKEKTRLITDKSEEKARVDEAKQQASVDVEGVMAELDGLSQEKADLLAQCSFLLKNFDLRQESRADEIDALGAVKAILAGMKG